MQLLILLLHSSHDGKSLSRIVEQRKDVQEAVESWRVANSGTSDKGHSETRTTSDNGQTKMFQLDILCVN